MKKKILALILTFGMVFGALIPSETASATCGEGFLGLRAWYYKLTEDYESTEEGDQNKGDDSNCKVRKPTKCDNPSENCYKDGYNPEDDLAKFIWQIVLNVLIDLFIIAGIVAIGFLIYGGYLYLRSGGDPNFASKGRKTITAALVGLVIVTIANVASRLIETIFEAVAPNGEISSNSIQTLLNWVYAIMGLVAVGGIIFGAVSWTTSQGDPGKIKKGKDAILYALIGLAIVLLAVAITNIVMGAANE